jgi:phosphate transport system substrate-binding protein
MTVNYGSGGSGKGRTDLASGVVNYAGSDSPIPTSEQGNFKGTVLYFPVVIAPITMSYHLSGVSNLKLSGPVIAKIFQAQVTTWNDPAITALNPGVTLPSSKITVVRRSDSSGTTQNFSEFLVKSAPGVWTLGSASTINWPASTVGGNGNGGVASIIKSTSGAIGYVDYPDARASGFVFAAVQNMAGQFVAPSSQSASEASSNATIAPNLTFSAIWAPGGGSYPITYQSWVLVYSAQSANTAQLLKAWVGYLVGDGQKLLPDLFYAPLPSNLLQMAQGQVSKIGSA